MSASAQPGGRAIYSERFPSHPALRALETTSRYLFLAVPGGLDRWFDAVADAKSDGSLDDALFRKLSDEFGIGWLE